MPRIVCVSGNIGAGKTTAVASMRHFATVRTEGIPESLLELVYNAPAKNAFAFQLYVMADRMRDHELATSHTQRADELVVLDRCVVDDVVFASLGRAAARIDDAQWMAYIDALDARGFATKVAALSSVVYVDVPPHVCLQRCMARGNVYESKLTLCYFEAVDEAYFVALVWLLLTFPHVDLVVVPESDQVVRAVLHGAHHNLPPARVRFEVAPEKTPTDPSGRERYEASDCAEWNGPMPDHRMGFAPRHGSCVSAHDRERCKNAWAWGRVFTFYISNASSVAPHEAP